MEGFSSLFQTMVVVGNKCASRFPWVTAIRSRLLRLLAFICIIGAAQSSRYRPSEVVTRSEANKMVWQYTTSVDHGRWLQIRRDATGKRHM